MGKQWKQCQTLFFWAPKSLQMVIAAMKLKDTYSLEWRRKWQPTPIFLPGESHGWRSLVGYSPLGGKELDTTEQLHFHFHREHCVWFKFLWIKNQRKYVSVYIQNHTCMCIYTCVYVYTTYTHMRKHTYKSFFKTNNLKKSINRGRYMEEPGRLQSMGSLRVGSLFTFMHWRRKWQPTPVFLPGESQGWESLVRCRLWGLTESDTTEAT